MTYLDDLAQLLRDRVEPALVPADADDLFRFYAVLLRAKGSDVTADDVHDAWSAWMQQRDPAHPSIVPFEDLTEEVRLSDEPYVEAIRAVALRLGVSPRPAPKP